MSGCVSVCMVSLTQVSRLVIRKPGAPKYPAHGHHKAQVERHRLAEWGTLRLVKRRATKPDH